MGLLKNIRLLFSDSLLERMLSLERRQELLEDYTDQKLDSMKAYSGRVLKRERDEAARSTRTNDRQEVNSGAPPDTKLDRLLARRSRRGSSFATGTQ